MKIFLTGATGFLGGELLVLLSKNPKIEKIYFLIRAKDEDVDINVRSRKIFSVHKDLFDKSKIIPVIGDMQDPSLSEKLLSVRDLSDVDTVIHSAANTSFSKMYDNLVERVNIGGTKQILAWAKTLKNLKTFVYVGTAHICGRNAKGIISEDESPNPDAKHLVKYCYTKSEGEKIVTEVINKEKLLVVRPSILLGDSRPWLPRSYVIMWAFAGFNLMRLIPMREDAPLDVISVDYAARAIISLLFAKRNHTVYHISAGKSSSSDIGKSVRSMLIGEGFPDPKFIPYRDVVKIKNWTRKNLDPSSDFAMENDEYFTHIKKVLGNGDLRILLGALDDYFKFGNLGQIFDNTRMLEDTGMVPPEPVHVYMERNRHQIANIDVMSGTLDP